MGPLVPAEPAFHMKVAAAGLACHQKTADIGVLRLFNARVGFLAGFV